MPQLLAIQSSVFCTYPCVPNHDQGYDVFIYIYIYMCCSLITTRCFHSLTPFNKSGNRPWVGIWALQVPRHHAEDDAEEREEHLLHFEGSTPELARGF